MKFFINGTRRGIGKTFVERWGTTDTLEECDIFINNKHDKYQQVDLLFKAAKLKKRIINISSMSIYLPKAYPYAVEKMALEHANFQLFSEGIDTTIVRFGVIDTERSRFIKNVNKISKEAAADIVQWLIDQPHRIMDISVHHDFVQSVLANK